MSFNCGINESIFAHLEKCVSKMKPINKICILMFDEIVLSPGLQHNSRTDSIEGFVDYGGSNRRLAFADHALSSIYRLTSVRTTQPPTLPPGHEPAETNWTVYKSTYTFSVNVVP
jgi:hypothetical protein